MDTWQQYTLRANTEFQLACYGNAILMHNQALDHARHQFSTKPQCCFEHALAKVMISNFSLADCYCALDEFKRAADCYLAAQQFLADVQSSCENSEESVQALLHAQSHLHALWCELLGKHSDAVPYESQLSYHHNSCLLVAGTEGLAVRH